MKKLVIVGQPTCRPCVQMKNELLDQLDDIKAAGYEFEYIDLNALEDKEAFIAKHQLTATPTILIVEGEKVIEKQDGYIAADLLIETLKGAN